jgi:hypothetical protein
VDGERLWVERVASGRETRALVKASHRGHGGHRGGNRRRGREGLWVDRVAFGRETCALGRHRTEGTEVTEGESASWTRRALVDRVAFGRETCALGRHRTEVTEVTEGDPV